jgi:hypothetical protein
MNLEERKYNIVRKILSTESETLVDELELLIGRNKTYDDLPKDILQKAINESIGQMKNGQVLTENELNKEIESWH